MPPEDLAELLNQLNLAEAAAIVSMLPLPRCIELCDQPTMRRRAAILEQLEPARVAAILEAVSRRAHRRHSEDGIHERHRIMPKFSPEVRAELEDLLQYPDHTAGGIMTTEFVRLDPKMTVGDALKHIRAVAQEKESIYACYIMDPETDRLLGAVSLRDLVMAELDRPLLKGVVVASR